MPEFTEVNLDRIIRADADGRPTLRQCYEHEIMLSFVDDMGAHGFREWWKGEGAEQFGGWLHRTRWEEKL